MAKYTDLEKYTFEYLIDTALSYVDDSLDKRKGSYIYDAIAPAMYKLAEAVLDIGASVKSSFIPFAGGEDLDNLGIIAGAIRNKATRAILIAEITDDEDNGVPAQIGHTFTSIDTEPIITYTITQQVTEIEYLVEPDVLGEYGNTYIGEIIPMQGITGLARAEIVDHYELATDEEDDDSFRERINSLLTEKPFGGNVSDYDRFVRDIDGIGDVQVYPVWNGGGTVKISAVGKDFRKLTLQKVKEVQAIVDPNQLGTGGGVAPIGHTVTVVTPTEVTIDITATLVLKNGLTTGQVKTAIEENIKEYFQELRKSWGKEDTLYSYNADVLRVRVLEAITSVEGIVNVTSLTMNDEVTDLVLSQTAVTQELPILGNITLEV